MDGGTFVASAVGCKKEVCYCQFLLGSAERYHRKLTGGTIVLSSCGAREAGRIPYLIGAEFASRRDQANQSTSSTSPLSFLLTV